MQSGTAARSLLLLAIAPWRHSRAGAAAATAAEAAAGGNRHHSSSNSQRHSTPAFADCIQRAVTPDVCAHLCSRGYAVVDGVFGPTLSHQLLLELQRLHARGLMHLNSTHLVAPSGRTQLLQKAHIWEAELTLHASVRAEAPLFAQLDEQAASLATMVNLFVPQLRLESHAIKLQHNEGSGGCFPIHADSDEMHDARRLTAIVYLNDAWAPAHGGQLRLYPFPAPPVDVAPLRDRLVLFSSTRMMHRVLPSRMPRSCFTIWLSESAKPRGTVAPLVPPSPEQGSLNESWRFLMQPVVRQHVCKLAYAAEWRQSLVESHPAGEALDAVLAKHDEELSAIRQALRKYAAPLEQLLDAADVAARAARAQEAVDDAAAAESSGGGGGAAGDSISEAELERAYALLRQVAAHVKFFG